MPTPITTANMMHRPALQTNWAACSARCGLDDDSGKLHTQLIEAWSEPHRHYHTLQHLNECLTALDACTQDTAQKAGVAMALWFHDAIYDVRAHDNEIRSAAWAQAALAEHGASPALATRVSELILATQHSAEPSDDDARLIVDIDLAILGATPERFAEYETQIRAEYAWVAEDFYRLKRREILQGFLNRSHIYSTEPFQAQYEGMARTNLQAAIDRLGAA